MTKKDDRIAALEAEVAVVRRALADCEAARVSAILALDRAEQPRTVGDAVRDGFRAKWAWLEDLVGL